MRDIRKYTVYQNNLDMLTAFKSMQHYFSERNYSENWDACSKIKYRIKADKNRTLETDRFDEFLKLLEKFPQSFPIYAHSHWKKDEKDIACIVDIYLSHIEITVESNDIDTLTAIHEVLKDIFKAFNPMPEEMKKRAKFDVKKSVFLAHRFDDEGNDASKELSKFLSRLGFDVAEGSGYEARDIPEKVARKIESQDIFVCIVTRGDTSWILSEAAYAKGLKKYIIVLCENGIEFKKGILGSDYEYMIFQRENITSIFSDLLYALPN